MRISYPGLLRWPWIVRHGCYVIKKACIEGMLRGILLPGGTKQQTMSQCADDSSFMVRGDKQYVDELVRLFTLFNEASWMEICWDKSCAWWFDKYTHDFNWTLTHILKWLVVVGYNWRWAEVGDLSKLLIISLGLDLNTPDIDRFLYEKISKKLDYWSNIKFSLAWRVVICNHVMLSILQLFIMVLGGSNKILKKISVLSWTTSCRGRSNSPTLGLDGKNVAWKRNWGPSTGRSTCIQN